MGAAGFGTAEMNAVQLGKALNDPIKGIAALAKSGVTFTEQEKDKIKTLVESNKLLEAQDMVLESNRDAGRWHSGSNRERQRQNESCV
jgi:hypothetical protein